MNKPVIISVVIMTIILVSEIDNCENFWKTYILIFHQSQVNLYHRMVIECLSLGLLYCAGDKRLKIVSISSNQGYLHQMS